MIRKLFVLTNIFLFLFAPQALTAPKKITELKLPNGLRVHEYHLSNGMHLLLVPDHSAPVFSYQVWFKVGSAIEKMDPKLKRTGLAHLFEHMMFRGTKNVPDQVFNQKISAAGAVGNNATTFYDRTNYFESLPKDRLELIFSLESDRMVNLALDDKLFRTELGAVIGEYKMRKDKPSSVAFEEHWDLAFTKHPYKYSVIGTLEELNSFTVEEAQYFYKTYYAPNNSTLILVGDFQISKALALAEKYYGKIPSQKIPVHTAPEEPAQKDARYRKTTHPLATSELILIGFKVPEVNHKDTAALEVLAAVLAYGNSSLLEQALVDKGLASSMWAGTNKFRHPALFTIGAQIAPGKTEKQVRDIIEENIQRIQDGKLSEEELRRAKNQFLLNAYSELNENANIGMLLGESLASADNYLRGFQILEEVKNITLENIVHVAKLYLKNTRSSTLLMAPGK